MQISLIKLNPNNPRIIKDHKFKLLVKSLKDFPEMAKVRPIVINQDNMILGGNMRYKAMIEAKWTDVPVEKVDWSEAKQKEFIIKDNLAMGEWDYDILASDYDLKELESYGMEILYDLRARDLQKIVKLTDKFLVPPFSILDTRQGYWQERRKKWLGLGIKSELGREKNLIGYSLVTQINEGTSVFDPVLCELVYRWFNIAGGSVLDPFAGGSVRGIVAEKLGYKYTGIELSAKQVEANRKQAKGMGATPTWINGDSNVELDSLNDKYDMIFSCPPYEDLEVYSDDPADISNMSHDDFNKVYKSIIKKAVSKLKDDSFVVWVVGEVRNKKGFYNLLIPNTIKFFEDAGAKFYNEIVLVNAIGTLPIRVTKSFQSGRKIGKMHQNVLVFYKGDVKNIKEKFGAVTVKEPPQV